MVIVAVPDCVSVPVFVSEPYKSRFIPVLIVKFPFPILSDLQTAPAALITGLLVTELITQFIVEVGTPAVQLDAVAHAEVVVPVHVVVEPIKVMGVPKVTGGA